MKRLNVSLVSNSCAQKRSIQHEVRRNNMLATMSWAPRHCQNIVLNMNGKLSHCHWFFPSSYIFSFLWCGHGNSSSPWLFLSHLRGAAPHLSVAVIHEVWTSMDCHGKISCNLLPPFQNEWAMNPFQFFQNKWAIWGACTCLAHWSTRML